MEENAITKLESHEVVEWVTPAEKFALEYFQKNFQRGGSETYPLAPSVCEGMLQLYLEGRTLAEIRKLNPQFGMGQIVHAAVTQDWHQYAIDHAELAINRARARAVLAAANGIDFAADLMAAIKKLHGDNIARYLQSGDVTLLGPALTTTTIKQMREIVDLLMKLTGQDQKKQVSGTLEIKHTGTVKTVSGGSKLAEWAKAKKEEE